LIGTSARLLRDFGLFEKRVRALARDDRRARLIMSAPGVGPLVALTYVCAIDDPSRFSSSKRVGPHFSLTPRKYQSGETDVTGWIAKIGDAGVPTALYEAAPGSSIITASANFGRLSARSSVRRPRPRLGHQPCLPLGVIFALALLGLLRDLGASFLRGREPSMARRFDPRVGEPVAFCGRMEARKVSVAHSFFRDAPMR
jgi:hypothetical protein